MSQQRSGFFRIQKGDVETSGWLICGLIHELPMALGIARDGIQHILMFRFPETRLRTIIHRSCFRWVYQNALYKGWGNLDEIPYEWGDEHP